jgi:hypothetical protein
MSLPPGRVRAGVPLLVGALWAGVVVLGCSRAVAECQASGRRSYTQALEALGSGDLSQSARLLLALLESQPECAEVRNNLAVVFAEQGRLEDAREQLREALRVRPDYQLARRNLERLDAMVAARTRPASPHSEGDEQLAAVAATPTREGPSQSAEPSRREEPAAHASPTPPAAPTPAAMPPTAESRAVSVGVIEPAHNRVCAQQRNPQGPPTETCFAIVAAQVRSWPRWLVATELTPQRIRLRDESGQLRLEIVRDNVSVTGDAVRLRDSDFDEFSAKIVPWRTAWVILE